jgi:two-component system OmpR family sensor kinase
MGQQGLDPSRALVTLQRLLEIPGGDLHSALTHAANALADAFGVDKVDAFLYDEARDSLVAVGASTQPLSNLQRNLGLDVLPISNGGRTVEVFKTGKIFRTGNTRDDPGELLGIREGLKVQSSLGVPLRVNSQLRGLVLLASLRPDYFAEADEAFAKSATDWVGMVAHRAELVEEIGRNALEEGRRAAADELVTVLAHDVRNYLSPISGGVYLLRHHAEQRGDAEGVKHAEAALRSVNGLSRLVTNLLDVARIDRGLFDLDLEPVDLSELAGESAGMVGNAKQEVIVKASETVIVAADRVRLRQCLDNLITNAAAHSPRGAPVNVFIDQYVEEDRAWGRLQVIDEGPGVPEAVLPHVFERFVTGRAKSGGVGLGLYLANRILRAHEGDIAVDSSPGKGSRFTLRLPIYQARNGSATPSATNTPPQA